MPLSNKVSAHKSIATAAASAHKIVVFDLDETLGCFVEIGMFWDALNNYFANASSSSSFGNDEDFNAMMDLFPDFLRPNIVRILEYLVHKKERKQCDQIMIYTNNQGPKSWTESICNYLNKCVGKKVFDQIVAAFMQNGKILEVGRTTHEKCVDDLVRCTQIPKDTNICFLDDRFHPLMEKSNVFYINVKPYTYSMPYASMAELYYATFADKIGDSSKKADFIKSITHHMSLYQYTVTPKSPLELQVDKIVTKRIVSYLEEFFHAHAHHNQTRRKATLWRKGKGKTRKI